MSGDCVCMRCVTQCVKTESLIKLNCPAGRKRVESLVVSYSLQATAGEKSVTMDVDNDFRLLLVVTL